MSSEKAPIPFRGVHPTAIVHARAELGIGVEVGPFSIIGEHVRIGDGARIHSHVVIDGYTTIGERAEVYPQACVGLPPQDKKYDGSPTKLIIGARTVIRECATLQPGSVGGSGRPVLPPHSPHPGDREGCGVTEIGDDCLIMAYCHVAHDCRIGNGVIMANATQVAGHCTVEDFAILGGVTTVHQFVRIGTRAITGASTRVQMDVPPYMMADGHPAALFGLNTVGLDRAGFTEDAKRALKEAYKALFMRGRYAEALDELEAGPAQTIPEVAHLCRFLRSSTRGVTRARRR
jgi:UDP-N-acetylglucosamine acyltransferase